jgi:tetratricopeptide (TPR) repeat protein
VAVSIKEEETMTATQTSTQWFETGVQEFIDGRYEKSIEWFTRAIDDDESALALVSRGAAYLKLDMLDQAWNDFDRAVAIDPGYARAYHMRGLVSEKRRDDRTALADFDRAIEQDPEYGVAYYSRATIHAKMDNTEKAQELSSPLHSFFGFNIDRMQQWREYSVANQRYMAAYPK